MFPSSLLLLSAVATPAAPVPKLKPPDGYILLRTADADAPLRLLTGGGELVRQLPIRNATGGALSPAGDRVAVLVRVETAEAEPGGPSVRHTHNLYVVPVDFDGRKQNLGDPLATGFSRPTVAWGGAGGTVYVSDVLEDPKTRRVVPGAVTVCDVGEKTAAVDESLAGLCVNAVSPDGERLLVGRLSTTDQWEVALIHHKTQVRVPAKLEGVELIALLGPDKLLGWYSAGKKAGRELGTFDLKADSADRVELPKEVSKAELQKVLVSPDGKRVLYETRPPNRRERRRSSALDPLSTACRLVAADPDGKNARVILDTAESETTLLDWR